MPEFQGTCGMDSRLHASTAGVSPEANRWDSELNPDPYFSGLITSCPGTPRKAMASLAKVVETNISSEVVKKNYSAGQTIAGYPVFTRLTTDTGSRYGACRGRRCYTCRQPVHDFQGFIPWKLLLSL